jgi:hypothetical protein
LRAQNVYVIKLGELLWRKRFRRSESHMAGIVDDDVEAPALGDDSANAGFDGFVRDNVKLDDPQINTVFRGVLMSQHHRMRGATLRIPHPGIDGMTGAGQSP